MSTTQPKSRRARFIAIAILVVLVVAIVFLAFRIHREGLFLLARIDIQGDIRIDSKEVVSLSGLTTADNVLFLSLREVASRIEENPLLIVTDIRKDFPDGIRITLAERNAIALARTPDGFMEVSADGALTTPLVTRYDLPIVSGAPLECTNGFLVDPDVRALTRILSNMYYGGNAFYASISELRYTSNDVYLYVKGHAVETVLDRGFTEEKLSGVYAILLHQGARVRHIDYRFQNPIVR